MFTEANFPMCRPPSLSLICPDNRAVDPTLSTSHVFFLVELEDVAATTGISWDDLSVSCCINLVLLRIDVSPRRRNVDCFWSSNTGLTFINDHVHDWVIESQQMGTGQCPAVSKCYSIIPVKCIMSRMGMSGVWCIHTACWGEITKFSNKSRVPSVLALSWELVCLGFIAAKQRIG